MNSNFVRASRLLALSCGSLGGSQVPYPRAQPVFPAQRRFKFTSRSSSTKKRCEEKPKKSHQLAKALTAAAVGATVAVVVAKHDDDFRDWARQHLPLLDDAVRVAYAEDDTYLESLAKAHKAISDWLKNLLYDVYMALQKKEDGSRKIGGGGAAVSEICEEKKPYKPPESAFILDQPEEKKIKNEGNLKMLKGLEDRLSKSVKDTIQAYNAAICAMKEQAAIIDNLEQHISKHECKNWGKFKRKLQEEQKNLQKAEEGLQEIEKNIENLNTRLEEDKDLLEDVKKKAKENINILQGDVRKAKESLDKEKDRMILAKRIWDKVRKARMHFAEELETLFPNVWLNDEKLKLPLDDLEPFIKNVLDTLRFYDKELAKAQSAQEIEFKSTQEPEGLVREAVQQAVAKEKRVRQEELQRLLLTQRAKCEKGARAQMKQQAEVFTDLLAEALALREAETERRNQVVTAQRTAAIKNEHRVEVAKLIGRLKGANEAIGSRGDKEKAQQEVQRLWSAAQSLLAAVASAAEPKPLKNEIANVKKAAADDDELIKYVLESIPESAVEKGVESETELKQRFHTVEKEAKKLAALPEGKVSLMQVFVARLQNLLYINLPIPGEELANEPIDVEEFTNFDILQRARYFVDQGDFELAVRYMNLLQGPASQVSEQWVQEVITYLETKQAAQLLLMYASAQ